MSESNPELEVVDRIREIADQVGAQRRAHRDGDRQIPRPVVEDRGRVPQDPVNHPAHYTSHPSGIECIQITEWMNFNCGNAVKYIWRSNEKGATVTDLKKARWYLDREIARLENL